ncbi:hypothetical protein GCM10007301_29340 [Azorhizobium oxalatiphilum]|uniref:Heat induced stress protein YflT n=1 Tax=Azorhizobium oxalatiphilum TaxID=980631 RepID=A0A917FDJ3_9HYPH|nr:general stress protein [Azorhizobium oxalatiphilum]GGF67754.1 hypothetical protein GCM10007301_29340 [Azorhizobium oxalatiphilum]
MTTTVSAMFDRYDDAASAVRELEASGISQSEISVVGNNADDYHASRGTDKSEVGEDAGIGAGVGAAIGGAGGLLTGLGMMAIPGVGPVVAAGWLVATAAGAAAGAVAGGAVGGLVGALTASGVPEADANVYAEGVRRGSTLVTARVAEADAPRAQEILGRFSAVDLNARREAYRGEGWTAFDETAPEYPRDRISEARRQPI